MLDTGERNYAEGAGDRAPRPGRRPDRARRLGRPGDLPAGAPGSATARGAGRANRRSGRGSPPGGRRSDDRCDRAPRARHRGIRRTVRLRGGPNARAPGRARSLHDGTSSSTRPWRRTWPSGRPRTHHASATSWTDHLTATRRRPAVLSSSTSGGFRHRVDQHRRSGAGPHRSDRGPSPACPGGPRGGDRRVRARHQALRPDRAGRPGRRQRPVAVRAGRQDLRARRSVGLRQDDVAQDGQPADRADLRPDPHRRRRRGDPRADRAAARDRLRDPVDRPVPAPDDRRERRRGAALLGWSDARRRERTDELLGLVGLDPSATATATRASCRAASANASGSPGRWRPTRR